MSERILTVLDTSPNAQAVLAQSLYLARLAGVSVHVLHVHSVRAIHAALPVVAAPVAGVSLPGLPPADIAVGAQAQWLVDQAVAQLVAAGVQTTGEVLDASEERAAEAIMERAVQLAVRLIVLGARHRGRLAMLFRPTVAERVCHYPCCPVLVVP
ncbi:MAG: universal stress protein [Pseudonocardiaceae bacterium]|jgi:nucleotide-binding universal stress UspA family protein